MITSIIYMYMYYVYTCIVFIIIIIYIQSVYCASMQIIVVGLFSLSMSVPTIAWVDANATHTSVY